MREGEETVISRFQHTELCCGNAERDSIWPNSRISSSQKKISKDSRGTKGSLIREE